MFPGSTTNLYGGTGISLNPGLPQSTAPAPQQPGNIPVGQYYTGTAPVTQGAETTYSAPAAAAPAPDPYAQWGGQSAYNSLVSGFGAQKSNIYGTSTDAANTSARGLNSSILDLIDQLSSGQRNIDNSASNNELAKMQGTQGVLGMVGRGIRSGGVQLANRNAGDSSATGALARAYGDIGRREMSKVGNQYEQGNQKIGLDQQNLDTQRSSGVRKITEGEANSIDAITAQARDRLAQLDASMMYANLPDRINIENEKNAIRSQVQGILAPHLDALNSGVGAVHASSGDDRRAQAAKLLTAGTDLGAGAFNFTDQVPAKFSNSGPFSSELPLFLQPGKKQTV